MAGVVDLRPVDGDGHQAPVDLDLAVLAHGVSLVVGERGFTATGRVTKCRSFELAAEWPRRRAEWEIGKKGNFNRYEFL
jgi:hypothetical protein